MTTTPDGGAVPAEDEELLARLRHVVSRADPVPVHVTDVSRTLLSWRHPDAEMAELAADSRDLAGAVRGDTDVILQFRTQSTEIVVQLTPTGDGMYRLVGQVEPPAPGTVEIRRTSGRSESAADEIGRFAADRLPSGPISLRWWPAGTGPGPVDTAWHLL